MSAGYPLMLVAIFYYIFEGSYVLEAYVLKPFLASTKKNMLKFWAGRRKRRTFAVTNP